MTKRIYKYPISVDSEVTVPLPKGAEVLCVAVQHDILCMWARVDDEAETEPRTFMVFGMGHEARPGKYIGTVFTASGHLVLHVFEKVGV